MVAVWQTDSGKVIKSSIKKHKYHESHKREIGDDILYGITHIICSPPLMVLHPELSRDQVPAGAGDEGENTFWCTARSGAK